MNLEKNIVSIVIPTTYKKNLKPLLNDIYRSIYKNLEIIIVSKGLERSAQRNIGIKQAKGKYMLLLDDDQHPSPQLINECVKLIEICNAIYIPEIIKTKGLFAKFRNWERQFYTGTLVDVVRFVKLPCPLFDETMSGPEDSDWDRRIKEPKLISINPLYHYDNTSMIKYFKKKAYYAKSMAQYRKLHPNDDMLGFRYRCWAIFTENGKWKRLIHPFTLILIFTLLTRGLIYAYSLFAPRLQSAKTI